MNDGLKNKTLGVVKHVHFVIGKLWFLYIPA